jgi:DNA-binding response OmpR family regulator
MRSRRSAGSPGTVLVVDADDTLRRIVRKWLESREYLVLDADEAGEAARIARLFVGPIHLVLLEVPQPAAAGRELAESLRATHAESQMIYTSMRPPAELARRRELASGQPFLRKPFSEEHLLFRIAEVLAKPA